MLAYTTLRNVTLHVDWGHLTNSSSRYLGLRFDQAMNYTFGFAMQRLYEYDDNGDNVDLSDNTYMVVHEFENTEWEMDFEPSSSQVKFTGNDSIILKVRGTL